MKVAPRVLLLVLVAAARAGPDGARAEDRGAAAIAAAFDSIQVREDRLAWAAQESLSVALARELERANPVDSLAFSRALLGVATGRLRQRLFEDGLGFDALERSIAIRTRHAAPGDPILAKGHWIATVMYNEDAESERARWHGEEGLRVLAAGSPPDTFMMARLGLALANAEVALGRSAEARANYERSIALRRAKYGPTNRSLVPAMAEYAGYLSSIGEFDAARIQLARALAIAERDSVPNSDLVQGCLVRMATLEDRAGNVAASIEYAQRAYEIARAKYGETDIVTVRARTALAYRLQDFRDYEASAAHLEVVVPLMESKMGAANPQTINARMNWIDALEVLGDTATARRELALVGPALAGKESLLNENRAHYLVLKAALERAAGRWQAAVDSLDEALRLERAKPQALAQTPASVLTHELRLVRGPSDRALLDRVVADADRLRDTTRVRATVQWPELLLSRAEAESRAGAADAAWAHALEAERTWRERFGYDVQALPDERALQLAERLGGASEVVVRLAVADGGGDKLKTAWERLIGWRGLVRQEVEARRAPAFAGADTALAGAHARWVGAQRRLAQWAVSGVAHPDDPATVERFATARAEAEAAERDYARRLGRGFVDARDSVTLERVLERLAPGTALVAFAVSGGEGVEPALGAFVAMAGDRAPRHLAIGPLAEIERAVSAWTAELATPPTSPEEARSLEQRSRALGESVRERLWDPIARAIATTNDVVIVPEGVVFDVPWMALPVRSGAYLAEGPVEITVTGAERELLDAAPSERAPGARLLALGGPDFDRPGAPGPQANPVLVASAEPALRASRVPCDGGVRALPSLPHARAEAEDVARTWGEGRDATLLVGDAASEVRFKHESPGRSVLHVATHGVAWADTCGKALRGLRGIGGVTTVTKPEKARAKTAPRAATSTAGPPPRTWARGSVWLALAGANRPLAEAKDENEGLLTAEEVVTLDLRGTDWVVLSACQSGLGRTWAREGVLGMRRAFHLAGARSVLASQWPVADEATREWMRALYAAETGSASAAVRHACREVLAARRKDGRSTAPFFWAAFTATGR